MAFWGAPGGALVLGRAERAGVGAPGTRSPSGAPSATADQRLVAGTARLAGDYVALGVGEDGVVHDAHAFSTTAFLLAEDPLTLDELPGGVAPEASPPEVLEADDPWSLGAQAVLIDDPAIARVDVVRSSDGEVVFSASADVALGRGQEAAGLGPGPERAASALSTRRAPLLSSDPSACAHVRLVDLPGRPRLGSRRLGPKRWSEHPHIEAEVRLALARLSPALCSGIGRVALADIEVARTGAPIGAVAMVSSGSGDLVVVHARATERKYFAPGSVPESIAPRIGLPLVAET